MMNAIHINYLNNEIQIRPSGQHKQKLYNKTKLITVYNYKGKEIGLIMNRITAEHDKQYRHLFIDTDVHESFRTIANNFAIENNYTMVD